MQLKRFSIMVLAVIACLLFIATTARAQEDQPTETDGETPVDPTPYIPPNFIFVKALLKVPEYSLPQRTSTGALGDSGLQQRVRHWANGCVATDSFVRVTAFQYKIPHITVDLLTTTDLVAGCSEKALKMAIAAFGEVELVEIERSTPAQMQGNCVALSNGTWYPSCDPACGVWTCAYTTVKNDASHVASVAAIAAAVVLGALIF